ncbi:MAG: FAD-dependent oxidoreductase [Verrucomicrobiales bacterium]|nr:FAD-dependent oxidoreductase [Verrucomicrobiales bacterium]
MPSSRPNIRFLLPLSVLAAPLLHADSHIHESDIVIYGGTSAGVIAAVQAHRLGKSVVLIEPSNHLGGLSSGGLGMTDSGDKRAIGGLARDFFRRVHRHYRDPEAWTFGSPGDLNRLRAGSVPENGDAMWVFEPRVAEKIFIEMLAECGPELIVHKRQRLNRETGVKRDGDRITGIVMESGETFLGSVFIDATYEGDLMAAAGCDYHVGRESNATHGETLNGIQKARNVKNHRFLVPVDPYVRPGDPASGLLPGISAEPPGEDGDGDHRIQAYCFRMCLSRDPDNRLPFPKPEGYDERRYELLLRNFEAGDLRVPLHHSFMPNGKTDTNNNGAFSTDHIGANFAYPEATYAQRDAIIRDHEQYQQGLMWTLANHPRVPESVRKDMSQWGLSADEFRDTGGWGHQLYIREARRLVGAYVMTEHDCRRTRICPDPVGLGSYTMDSHNCQRYVDADGHAQNEGDVQVATGGAYAISYRSIVPKTGQTANLLVPVALSASHIAYGSIRMEPVFMILGQSAATAASIAIDDKLTIQTVPYARLRERLIADGQILDLPPDAKPQVFVDPATLPGLVLDDTQAEWTGAWNESASNRPYIGQGYRHDGHDGIGGKSATFRATLPRPGRYAVRLSWSVASNRATNATVTLTHRGGRETVRVNQRQASNADANGFSTVATLDFDTTAEVVITNDGADGHVVVDAVQWLPEE